MHSTEDIFELESIVAYAKFDKQLIVMDVDW